jgi:hypothetical protein
MMITQMLPKKYHYTSLKLDAIFEEEEYESQQEPPEQSCSDEAKGNKKVTFQVEEVVGHPVSEND